MGRRTVAAIILVVTLSGCIDSGPYYSNCEAAREAGVAPLKSGDPGYRSALDRNQDGIACEES